MNSLYDKGRQKFAEGSVAWLTDTIKVCLIAGASYTPSLATHEFLSDIPAAARVAISPALANKTTAAGVMDADDVTLTSVTGAQVTYIAIFKDTGNVATSPLLGLLDSAAGLPVTPNGGNLTVVFDNGANRILKL